MSHLFQITYQVKRALAAVAFVGVLFVGLSIILGDFSANYFWANLLLNGYLFLAISGAAMLFLAIHTIAESGWHAPIQRVVESIGCYLPYAGLILLLVIPGITTIYEWSHPTTDKLILGKQGFLNVPFFLVRTFGLIAIWAFLIYKIRHYSLLSDMPDRTDAFKKMKRFSAIYVPLFVFTFFFSSWDWIMSLEPHWFSTMFGFYMVSSAFAVAVSTIIILVLLIKYLGGAQSVNTEHTHDLAKYLFGISLFWGYLWGSQYLLIWFSNLPEESVYYVKRWNDFPILMYVSVALNFFVPLFGLMTRASKRNNRWLFGVSVVVLIGHWVDYYLAIVPGATQSNPSITFGAVGMTLIFVAIFLYVVLVQYAKKPQEVINHPYTSESGAYENGY